MVTQEQIARINELAKKKKAEGLTAEETKEQAALRKLYIQSIRENLKAQLDNIEFVDDKPEADYTEEEKQHVQDLSEKLKQEYDGQEKSITEQGNPRKPVGEAGKIMVNRMNESHADMTAWALGYGEFKEDDTVLDVGCGGGAALARIEPKIVSGHLTGIDYSPVSVEESQKLNAEAVAAGKMDILEASVSDLPFEDGAFTKIITVESYYFWPDINHDMKEIFRVLKPGGRLLLIAEIYFHEGLKDKDLENVKKYEMRNYSEAQFEALFVETGFKEVAIHHEDGEDWICVEGIK